MEVHRIFTRGQQSTHKYSRALLTICLRVEGEKKQHKGGAIEWSGCSLLGQCVKDVAVRTRGCTYVSEDQKARGRAADDCQDENGMRAHSVGVPTLEQCCRRPPESITYQRKSKALTPVKHNGTREYKVNHFRRKTCGDRGSVGCSESCMILPRTN